MHTRLDHLDGINRHARIVARAAERDEALPEAPESGRVARLAQAFGHGAAAHSGFARDVAYRRQLGDLISIVAEARGRTVL